MKRDEARRLSVSPNKSAVAFQYWFGAVAGLSAFTSGAWLAWASAAMKEFGGGDGPFPMTTLDMSTATALMDLGNILTPIPTSYAMDWIGRMITLYFSAVTYIVASILVFFATDRYYVYFGRICAGLSKGISFAAVPIYAAESANPQIRGSISIMFFIFLHFGMTYGYFFDWLMTYQALNWAILAVPIVFVILFFMFRDSPYFYAMKGKHEAAQKSLASFRRVDKEDKRILMELALIEKTVEVDMKNKPFFFDVVKTKTNRRALLIVSLLSVFQRWSGISPTLAYMPKTLPKTGGGHLSIQGHMFVFSIVLVLALIFPMLLIDRWGRKPLLVYSALTAALVQFAAGLFYLCQDLEVDVSSWTSVPYACLHLFAFTYSFGIGYIPSTLVGELFPQNVRSYASSISAILLAAASFSINKVFLHLPVYAMYFFFTFSSVLCLIFSIFFVFETKGKTFMEIQMILKEKVGETTED